MNTGQQILFFVGALGAFNGFVLGLYILSKKGKSITGLLFSIMLLAISIRVIKSVLLYFNPNLPKVCLQTGLSACFLIGPSLYYFLKSALKKVTQIPVAWKWTWGIILGLLIVGGILVPYWTYPEIWN